jgi:flagellar hook protein FlgE
MMTAIEEYLGLGKSFNNKDNVTIKDGVITVVGEKGAANDIAELTLTGIPESELIIFNEQLGRPTKDIEATKGQYSTDMPIFDGQGNKHLVRFDFGLFNEERNEWSVRLSTDEPGTSIDIPGATTNELIIRFNADGTPSYIYDRMSNPEHVVSEPTLNLFPANGSSAVMGIDLNLGTTGKYDGLVLSSAPMSISLADQDGYALGVLDEKMFSPAGEIVGYYSNGEIRTIGQVALATFQNDQGLLKMGDTMFAETGNSGPAAIGTPQSGSRGQIASSALEQSNVNLSDEFVNMIVTERGFQANSRVVTTSDEMIQELLNLKR